MPAVERENPYSQFNFTVDLGAGIRAGFQEVSGIGMEVAVAEYRNGNDPTNNVRKVTGLNKASDVTMKRGAIGVLDLYGWLDEIRNGTNNGIRNVTVNLMSENRTTPTPVMTWRLRNARIIKYTSGPFNAKGNDVAMEELVLSYEQMVMDT
ncbi:MAG: phage tail protein [Chloroflexales bacterium]|nr:phage tail protein [Chloroflexales bacterium]